MRESLKLDVSTHETGISLRVRTCPHLLVLFTSIDRLFFTYIVLSTSPCLFSCISHFSWVDREKQNKDAAKVILVVKKQLRERDNDEGASSS